MHRLHHAAGEAECHGPDQAPPRLIHQVVHLGHHEVRRHTEQVCCSRCGSGAGERDSERDMPVRGRRSHGDDHGSWEAHSGGGGSGEMSLISLYF